MQPAAVLKGKSPFVRSWRLRPETQTPTCFPRHRRIPTQPFEEFFRSPRGTATCFSTDLPPRQTLEHLLHLRDLWASEGQGCSVIFIGVYTLNTVFGFDFFSCTVENEKLFLSLSCGGSTGTRMSYRILNFGASVTMSRWALCWGTTSVTEHPPSAFIGAQRTLKFGVRFHTKLLSCNMAPILYFI